MASSRCRHLDAFLRDSVNASTKFKHASVTASLEPASLEPTAKCKGQGSNSGCVVGLASTCAQGTELQSSPGSKGKSSKSKTASIIHGQHVSDDGLHEACEERAIKAGLLAILTVNMRKMKVKEGQGSPASLIARSSNQSLFVF